MNPLLSLDRAKQARGPGKRGKPPARPGPPRSPPQGETETLAAEPGLPERKAFFRTYRAAEAVLPTISPEATTSQSLVEMDPQVEPAA